MGKKLKLYKNESQIEDLGSDFVIFLLCDETYALNISSVNEILKPKEATDIPGTPEYLYGVVNIRGKIVPVIDLRLRFALKAKEVTKLTRIVVVQQEEQHIGLMVDAVLSVQPIPDRRIEEAPEMLAGNIDSDFFEGIANLDNNIISILNLEKILRKPGQSLSISNRE